VDPDGDLVEFGSPERRSRWLARYRRWPARRRRGLGWLLLLAVAVVVVVVEVADHRGPHRAAPPATVTVTDVGHRLLGITAGWELFGRGPGGVVSVQFAAGRITHTVVPPLQSTGAVSFVVSPHEAIIRPLDFVPGYAVPDGERARPLPGLLNQGGPLTPGPHPGQLWMIKAGPGNGSLLLVGLDGKPTGAAMRLPATDPLSLTATPDGTGNVLFTGTNGVYDARLGRLREIGPQLTAVGPGRWLAVTCPHGHGCANVVTNTASGTQRTLPGPPVRSSAWPPGVISPDGSAAAVLVTGTEAGLDLINLDSGVSRAVAVQVSQESPNDVLAWSPDSRWLFVVAADGKILAINARTHHVASLGVRLPYLSQIAIRAAPGPPHR
jgi:hypothetical protein